MKVKIIPQVETTMFQETDLVSWGSMLTNLRKFGCSNIRLVAETANPKDKHAVAVYNNTAKIGYIPKTYTFKDDIWSSIQKKQAVTAVAMAVDNIETATQLMLDIPSAQPKGVDESGESNLEPLTGAVKAWQDHMESQMDIPDTQTVQVEGIKQEPKQEFKYSYNITKMVYLKPNPAKGPYSQNWYGYVTLHGTFNTEPGNDNKRVSIVDGAGEEGIQVSLFKRGDKLVAYKAKPSNHSYANKAVISPQYEQFLTVATAIVNLIDLLNKPKSENSLFTTYTGDIRCASRNDKLVSRIVRS